MKRRRLFPSAARRLAAAVMTAVLCVSMHTAQALAAPPTATGDESNPAKVSIWKNIQMPTGINTPAGTATFQFAPVTVDGTPYVAVPANMPAIPDRTVVFTVGDAGDASTDAGGIKTVSKKTVNILDGVVFPHAGEYVYTVTEQAAGFTLTNTAAQTEQMDYSTVSYRVQVLVSNKNPGPGVYVSSISVNNYTPGPGTIGAKVNSTSTVEGTGFAFTNKFNRTNLGSAANPDAALGIHKQVSGSSGDMTAYFPFSVTVQDPASLSTGAPHGTYKAVIVDGGAAVDPAPNGISGASPDHSFNVTAGAAFTFKLKHGQILSFLDLPVGATYTASETDTAGHMAYLKVTTNGVAGTESTASTTGAAKLITEGQDKAEFRNDKALATPTGILLNNLPYVLLLGFAGLAILAVVAKKRTEE